MTAAVSRRRFLRAAGVTLALPLLDRFTPRAACGAEAKQPIRRMVCMNTTLGIYAPHLIPEQAGTDYTPTAYLDVLKDFRQETTVFSGVSHPDVDGGHSSEASFLTAAPHPGSSSFRNSISLDQLAVERIGAETRFASLTLTSGGGNGSISFSRSGVMQPADNKPSVVFKKLFLEGTPAEVRQQVQRLEDGQSILDLLLGQAKRLQRTSGAADRERLDQYLGSVREVEQRLQKAEEWTAHPKPKVEMPPPTDITNAADILGRTRLLFDLVQLALQTDSTRVVTVLLQGHNSVPPIDGITQDWHNLSHHGKDPEKIAQLKIIEAGQFTALQEFLAKLKGSSEDADSLLDRTMVLYGSNLGNAASHDTRNMPMLLAGGGFRHGQHLAFDAKNNTAVGQIYVGMLQRLGIETDQFASGKGRIRGLELV
jgi:hypothetical protein